MDRPHGIFRLQPVLSLSLGLGSVVLGIAWHLVGKSPSAPVLANYWMGAVATSVVGLLLSLGILLGSPHGFRLKSWIPGAITSAVGLILLMLVQ